MTRVAVLDDYQRVAHRYADWGSLPEGSRVEFFHDRTPDEAALIERLSPFEVIVAMRERTPFCAQCFAATAESRVVGHDRTTERRDRRRGSSHPKPRVAALDGYPNGRGAGTGSGVTRTPVR